MKYLYDVAVAYKLVWVKAVVLIILPAAMLFDSYTETWSEADWRAQSSFARTRLYVKMGIASAGALISFIDKSLGRASDEFEQRRRKRLTEKEKDIEL